MIGLREGKNRKIKIRTSLMLARVSCSTGTRDLNKGNGEGNSRPVGEQDRVRGLESLEEY